MRTLVGIDVGTSGVKAIAVDADTGSVVADSTRPFTLETPRPGWAEQDAEAFATQAREALREVSDRLGSNRAGVLAIGLTGQMHSAVLLDEDRHVIRPAILWCDTRTTAECDAIRETMGAAGLLRTVANRALEGFTLPKLLWLRTHEPAAYARIRHVLMPKDYVGLDLTGELATDVSDASGTLAFDPRTRRFSDEILQAVGVPRAIWPEARESPDLLGQLTESAAAATGLRRGTPVVHGAADNAAGAVGLGVVAAGRAMASIGTSGVVLAHTDDCVVETEMRLHAFCHAVPGRAYLMGVMLAAGGALRWYRDTLCDGEKLAADLRRCDPYEILTDAASTSRPGAGGLVFLPYLLGERTPHDDALARGAFVGLSARTTKADISRAVLEGITFGLADSVALMRDLLGGGVGSVRMTGGGAKSPFWRQLLADVFEAEVLLTTSTEGPAFGAAILAGVGAGAFASVVEGCDALVHVTSRVAPDPSTAARYREIHGIYRGLYTDLRARFRDLGRLA